MHVESNSQEQGQQPLRRLFLLYHELRASQSQYSYVTEAGLFERHLDLYVRLRQAEPPCLRPELTFDDGHASNFEIAAPILASRGLTAQFFITVGWTAQKPGYMGWPQLQSLHRAGHSIGAHGWTHKLLTHCSDRELQTELDHARLTLENRLGTAITTMSLPGGRSNRRVLTACRKAGYTQVYTSIPKAEPSPLGATVGRLNILGNMQPQWIEKLFQPDSAVLLHLERQYRVKDTAKTLLGDRLYTKLWAFVNRAEAETDRALERAE